jgi:uncharacterized integral membrane protein
MRTIKIIFILALAALAAVFIYQNAAVMQLTFLFWSISTATSLIVLAAFFAGFIAGFFLLFLSSRNKGSKMKVCNIR